MQDNFGVSRAHVVMTQEGVRASLEMKTYLEGPDMWAILCQGRE
jgi:hypothetical protein